MNRIADEMDMLAHGIVMRTDNNLMFVKVEAFDHVIRSCKHLVIGWLLLLMPGQDQVVVWFLDARIEF